MKNTVLLLIFLLGLFLGFLVCKNEKEEPEATTSSQSSEEAIKILEEELLPTELNEGEKPDRAPVVVVNRKDEDFDAGTVGDVSVVRLFADVFPTESQKNRVLAYQLSRAVIAGRDIAFDQVNEYGLEVRTLLRSILDHNVDLNLDLEKGLSDYLKLLEIHGGFFDQLTGKKFIPSFTFEQLEQLAKAANALGAELGLSEGEPIEAKLSRLRKVIFDPNYQNMLASPIPLDGEDLLMGSNLNIYRDVTMTELSHFKEAFPLNSRLIRVDKNLVEEVYRMGDKRQKIPAGRYARELGKVVQKLNEAMFSAPREHRKILAELVDYFRTGNHLALQEAIGGWNAKAFDVEFVIGFNNTGLDPRGVKGIFHGLVAIKDQPVSSRVSSLTLHTPYFEEQMPWPAEYKKQWGVKPLGVAAQLLEVAGKGDELCPFGFRLPFGDGQVERWPRKSLIFTNVVESHWRSVGTKIIQEFIPPIVKNEVMEKGKDFSFMRAAIREVLGRELGVVDPKSHRTLGYVFEIIEELKAELTALYLLADPKLNELGLVSGIESAFSAYRYFVAEAGVAQALTFNEQLANPTGIAQRIMVRFLVEKAKVVQFKVETGKTYLVISDMNKFRMEMARLMIRSERILATNNRRSAMALIKKYSPPPNWACLSELANRAKSVGLHRLVAYQLPLLKREKDSSGKIVDAFIEYH